MAKYTGIKGNISDTPTVIGQRFKVPPPTIGEYTSIEGIEGNIKNATTVTGQIFESAAQLQTDWPISVDAAPQGASVVSSRPPPSPPPPNRPLPSPPPPNISSPPPPYVLSLPPPSPPSPNISLPPPNVPSPPPPNVPSPPPPNVPRPSPPNVPSPLQPANISNHGQEAIHTPNLVETIPEVGIPFENLHNDNPRELLHVVRRGKTLSLWEIEQIQIQYGLFHDIPWCILGFRLKKGLDKKDCLEVRVEGIVKGRGADIKGIWPSQRINDLVEFETRRSSGLQFRIGIDSTAKALTSLALTTEMEHTFVTGQTLVPEFEKQRFSITLGVKKGSPNGTCVASLVEFYILVQLSKERAAMTLEVTANVVYKGWSRKRQAQGQEVCFYSGDESDDIRKANVQRGENAEPGVLESTRRGRR